ncbi:hypothetical protein AWC38_SpisGene10670 [Stylophora pistillata]|uniref:Uncharacterized protein n=1 Tax=Stylophora pistillata TaxID=50429 RepID=A0A2B4S224_STYPI|nr:hypothetical protein AWC38_SpisGene10670 [Stylophora pistillata]
MYKRVWTTKAALDPRLVAKESVDIVAPAWVLAIVTGMKSVARVDYVNFFVGCSCRLSDEPGYVPSTPGNLTERLLTKTAQQEYLTNGLLSAVDFYDNESKHDLKLSNRATQQETDPSKNKSETILPNN